MPPLPKGGDVAQRQGGFLSLRQSFHKNPSTMLRMVPLPLGKGGYYKFQFIVRFCEFAAFFP